jgi:hypothetical protein
LLDESQLVAEYAKQEKMLAYISTPGSVEFSTFTRPCEQVEHPRRIPFHAFD